MEKNIVEQIVVPYNAPPARVVQKNQFNLFTPKGGINRVGVVGYSEDFTIKDDIVSISSKAGPIAKNAADIAKNAAEIGTLSDTKLDCIKPTTAPTSDVKHMYAADSTGKAVLTTAKSAAEEGSLVLRDTTGRFTVFDPVNDTEPASKKYVDGQVDTRVEKLTPNVETYPYPYVYTVDGKGVHSLVKTNYGAAPNTIVIRNNKGFFVVDSPEDDGHPVNKTYFDKKTNNSLYLDHNALERRVANIEYGSNGKIYDTVELNGAGSALQVSEALPYGILSRIGGAVKKVTIGLPYSLDKDKLNVTKLDYDSFIVPGGAMPWFPCKVPVGATITASYTSERNTLRYYSLFASKSAGGQVMSNFASGVSCTPESDAVATKGEVAYIGISRTGTAAEKAEPDTLYNLRVMFEDPSQATVETVIEEIIIPDEVTSLEGYGEEGSYLDLTERKFYRANGTAVDVSSHLPIESDVISLLPGAIIKFTDANEEAVATDYSFSYKNKITI